MELQHNNLSGKYPLTVHKETQIILISFLKVRVVSAPAKPKANSIQCEIFQ